jgi:hypothetical protein
MGHDFYGLAITLIGSTAAVTSIGMGCILEAAGLGLIFLGSSGRAAFGRLGGR